MSERSSFRSHFGSALIGFVLFAFMAILLLLTAFVVWLAERTGSLIMAAALVGAFFAVLSTAIYLLVLKDAIRLLGSRMDTVYEVARTAQAGYEWLTKRVVRWLGQE